MESGCFWFPSKAQGAIGVATLSEVSEGVKTRAEVVIGSSRVFELSHATSAAFLDMR
jgi:hypothetical protein